MYERYIEHNKNCFGLISPQFALHKHHMNWIHQVLTIDILNGDLLITFCTTI